MSRDRPVGAYGLTLRGISSDLLVPVPAEASWPEIDVCVEFDTGFARKTEISERAALLPLVDYAWARLDRSQRSATLVTACDDDGETLHPFLATAAVIFSWWLGRSAFHGGAVMDADRRAWGVLGNRGAGKSSTLAGLAAASLAIVTDDLLVVDGHRVFAGPRMIDLRPDAADALGFASSELVRRGERRRVVLGPAPAELPIAGWIFLAWGDEVSLRRLRPAEWLARATAQLNTITRVSPSLLSLADTRAYVMTRPMGLELTRADNQ